MKTPTFFFSQTLREQGRKPRLSVFENVVGALSSNGGADFSTVAGAFASAGYRFGAVVLDARLFVPQSRPRLFIVGVDESVEPSPALEAGGPQSSWHPKHLIAAVDRLAPAIRRKWVWWSLPSPVERPARLSSLIEENPNGVEWHTPDETEYLLSLMNEGNRTKVEQAKKMGHRVVGTVYRRTRPDQDGAKRQRAEVRFDDIAGCLRTPTGGSSRQTLLIVEGQRVRSRLLSPREAARLMGLPDRYKLPATYNDSYHLTGDGVVVPVVGHLEQYLLKPLLYCAAAHQLAAE